VQINEKCEKSETEKEKEEKEKGKNRSDYNRVSKFVKTPVQTNSAISGERDFRLAQPGARPSVN